MAQIIAPGQTGQDLPYVPTMKPRSLPDVDRSWTLRRGKRPPPPRWERENGFAAPPPTAAREMLGRAAPIWIEKRVSARHPLHQRIRDLEVREDILHVVMLVEQSQKLDDLFARLVVDADRVLRLPDEA